MAVLLSSCRSSSPEAPVVSYELKDSEVREYFFSNRSSLLKLEALMETSEISSVSVAHPVWMEKGRAAAPLEIANEAIDLLRSIGASSFGNVAGSDYWFINLFDDQFGRRMWKSKGLAFALVDAAESRNPSLDALESYEFNIPEFLNIEGSWHVYAIVSRYP